jgi:ribosomal protein S6--L-glutamate ligase
MRVAILSRNKNLYSIRRLIREARKAKFHCDVINPLECQLVVDGSKSQVVVGHTVLPNYDAVLPRIGASITEYGLSVVKHFEMLGVRTINSSQAIAESRNKMRCLQILTEAGILVPATVLTRSTKNLLRAVEAVKGLPVVLKILQGTQGVGVMLVHTPVSLGSVLDTLRTLNQDVIVQQFIVEGAGRDFRVFVIGDRVIASMMRTAPEGEFRSNIHQGGEGNQIDLPPLYEKAAIKAAKTLGLSIAGVDLMESNQGPLVIEVNSSPGFEGIEKATQINVAAQMIKYLKKTMTKETVSR